MSRNNILVTVTGPSVTGKSKLATLLKPLGFEELVSTTTRPPREGEINGVHYNFVTPENFETMVKNNLMIEKVIVGKNFYGVSLPALEAVIHKGKNGVAVVEPNGAQQVNKFCKANNIELHQVFINNSLELLLERLFDRYRNDKLASSKVYATRALDMCLKEQKEWVEPAYNGTHYYDQRFDHFTPENENEVVQHILNSTKLKISNQTPLKLRVS